MASEKSKRWVEVPLPQGSAQLHQYEVRGVYLDDEEEVEWIWTHVDGRSFVSGYRIVESVSKNCGKTEQM